MATSGSCEQNRTKAYSEDVTDVDKLLAIEKPKIYLREIKQFLMVETGTEVDISTICRFLKESGFTR